MKSKKIAFSILVITLLTLSTPYLYAQTQSQNSQLSFILESLKKIVASFNELRNTQSAAVSDFDSSLVAHYPFNSNANDSEGSNDGSVVGVATYGTGQIGNSINLSNGSFVRTTTSSGITGYPFTISVWVKPSTGGSTFQALAGLYNTTDMKGIAIGASGKAAIFVTNSFGQDGTTNIKDGSWHHIVGVYTSTTAKLYVDGSLEVNTGWEPEFSTSPMHFAVSGWDRYDGSVVDYPLTGSLDDFRIYNKALSSSEISDLFTDVGTVIPPVVNGSCGPAAKTYTATESFPSGALCSAGTASPSSPSNPTQGGSTSWSCTGTNGGTTASCSASRNIVSSDTQAPTIPGIPVSSNVTSTSATLTWTASTDNIAVTRYAVERCTGTGCSNFGEVGTPSSSSYTNTGLTANTTYLYRVKAIDAAGNSSNYSNTVSVTTPATATTYTLTVSKSGTGSGTVTGVTINCGSTCAQSSITSGTQITLSASPANGSTFTGWSGGGCSGMGTCTVTVNANMTVTATFATQVVSNELLITNISPKGKISNSANQITLSLNTNRSANCKYSRTAGSIFNEADVDFSTTGGTSHSVVISNLVPSKSYHYFARCTGGGKTSLDMPVYFHTGDWVAPVGIPDPKNSFGGFGVDRPTPSWPASWTAATPSATPNYFYVDNTASNATDAGNMYGHPGLPRMTPPAFWTHTLTPGAFVYINAGLYTVLDASIDIRNTHGTAQNPIWFSGNPNNHPILENTVSMGTYGGASYIVFENIDLRSGIDRSGTRRWAGIDIRPTTPGTSVHHILIRNSTLTGTAEYNSFGGIGIGGSELSLGNGGYNVSNIAIFNVNVNTNGAPTEENSEQTGIYKAHKSDTTWVLDSTIHAVGADGVAGAHNGNDTDHVSEHYYIGRNVLYESGENCIDLKSTRYVVISENECWGPFGREQGWGIVIHSGGNPVPVRDVWLINNRIHHASAGIVGASTNGTQDVSVIGNSIYDIKARYAFHSPSDGPDPQYGGHAIGILAAAGINNYVLNNTIYNSDRGIALGQGAQVARVHGNIINSPTTPPLPGSQNYFSSYRYYDILFDSIVDGQQVFGATNDYNFYPSTTRIERGNSVFTTVDQFRSATNEEDHGLSGNPLFVNPSNADFRLQSGSPAINASANFLTDANLQLTARRNAATDQNTVAFYNELIADLTQNPVDFIGVARPQSGLWDTGAYEYTGPLTNAAPTILSHPQSQTKAIGEIATFTVSASGYPAPAYQWVKNGVNILNAAASSYTTPPLTQADNGALYTVTVTNSQGSRTSNPATLTIGAGDTTPPTISFTSPTNGSTVSGTVNLAVTTSPDTVSVEYFVNGTSVGISTSAPFNGTWSGMSDGNYTLKATAKDAAGNSADATINVTVLTSTVNVHPVLTTIGNKTIAENSTLTITPSATDGNSDPLTYTATNLPTNASFSNNSFTFSPSYTQSGTYTVTFNVSDGRGGTDTETITITVTNTNRPPVANAGVSQTVGAGTQARLSASGSFDLDQQMLIYTWSKVQGPGTVTFSSNTSVNPTALFSASGSYTLRVTVSDTVLSSTADVNITVSSDPNADFDGDRINDSIDRCPNSRGVTNSVGCPIPRMATFTLKPDLSGQVDLTYVSSLELGNTHGKVSWNAANTPYVLVRNTGSNYDAIDIDTNLKIIHGEVNLTSSALPELNRPATITLNNINIPNPAILRDSDICDLCHIVSTSNNTFVFTVPGFSRYTIVTNNPPTVSITAPTSSFSGNTTIKATATDDIGIESVSFYANNTLVAKDTTTPYETSWSPSAGVYSLTAIAKDEGGLTTTSNSASITVTAPTRGGGRGTFTPTASVSTLILPDFTKMTLDQKNSWIRAKIAELIIELNALLIKEGKQPLSFPGFSTSATSNSSTGHVFSTDLYLNITHPDVWHLQRFLNTHGYPVGTNIGSYGKEVTTFGPVTEATLKKFQAAQGIQATGYFGPVTRVKVNGWGK